MPQSHISKIENNQVDLRLSSFVAIANALGLQVALVPRKAMPAVQLIARQSTKHTASQHSQPAHATTQRNQLTHAPWQQEFSTQARPAYSLDDEDEP